MNESSEGSHIMHLPCYAQADIGYACRRIQSHLPKGEPAHTLKMWSIDSRYAHMPVNTARNSVKPMHMLRDRADSQTSVVMTTRIYIGGERHPGLYPQ